MDNVPAPQVNETSADQKKNKKQKNLVRIMIENIFKNNVPRHIYLY